MAASNSGSRSNPSGECVVCGQITSTRCSECSRHGTQWMYFCSKEHQRLIWPAHKRVCGPRSEPFHWPLLSDKEVETIMAACDKPYDGRTRADVIKNPHSPETTTFLDDWQTVVSDAKVDRRYFRNVLNNYKTDDPSIPDFQQQLATIRFTAHRKQQRVSEFEKGSKWVGAYELFKDDPIGFMVTQEREMLRDYPTHPENYQPWWSRVHHRAYHLVTMYHLLLASCSNSENNATGYEEQLLRYTRHAFRSWHSSLDEVAAAHPDIYKLLYRLPIKNSSLALQSEAVGMGIECLMQ
ncbi:hypothetical protein JCM5353_006564 [Sporobolomyces roseus]